MKRNQIIERGILFLLLILFSTISNVFADDVKSGEKIFKQNCTACHMITSARLVGPGLQGVTEKYEREWLIKWIRNSQALIKSGDERAIKVWEEYDKVAMASYDFSDQEFSDLLAYLAAPPVKEEVVASSSGALIDEGMSTSTMFMIIALVLVVLVFLLVSLKNNLKSVLNQQTETIPQTLVNQFRLFISKNVNVFFICLVFVIVVLKFGYDGLMGVGVTTNYAPAQPIAFSHKIHAGQNGVDCNYCHTSARKSKHSGIPSANVCMNCHTYISEGSIAGTKEIQKIYDAVGFDASTKTYIEGYEQKPIEWVRIHNLPDHAYFQSLSTCSSRRS
jgi:cytochrome c551/c552